MARAPDALAVALNAQRKAFKAFLAARVGSEAEAEDLLQEGLLKAVRHGGSLQDNEKLEAWFYQLLRHVLIDYYRSRGAARRREDQLGQLMSALGDDIAPSQVWRSEICRCLGGVVATLKPGPAQMLRRVDLEGESVQDVAKALGLTPNNASVMLHRARKELRIRLEDFCGDCSEGACLDCDCAENSS